MGTDPTGLASFAVPAPSSGIVGHGVDVQVGGTTAGSRNLISGNYMGLEFFSEAIDGLLVQGNYFGTDPSGLLPVPNSFMGLSLGLGSGTIGGTTPSGRNIIAESNYGISMQG